MVNPGIARVEDTGTRSVHRGGVGSRWLETSGEETTGEGLRN